MNHEPAAYGLWGIAFINAAIFIMFAYSFAPPKTSRDWRSFGVFSAFLVALFAEMYGFPLTIYLLSGWLGTAYPGVDWLSHDAGHLLEMLFGWRVNPHFGPFHVASYILIFAGFWLIASAWRVLYRAQKTGTLAVSGAYARLRHPQYIGFVLVLTGFLLQWPTLLTLAMYPILVYMYVRLAKREEQEARAAFGEEYERYARHVPAFFPQVGRQVKQTV
ncbi:MAG: methyltransferase family protein [Pseudomonadota bacterium]